MIPSVNANRKEWLAWIFASIEQIPDDYDQKMPLKPEFETVVGTISDPAIRRACVVVDTLHNSLKQLTEETNQGRDATEEQEKTFRALKEEHDFFYELLYKMIRDELDLYGPENNSIGIRNDWQVVKLMPPQCRQCLGRLEGKCPHPGRPDLEVRGNLSEEFLEVIPIEAIEAILAAGEAPEPHGRGGRGQGFVRFNFDKPGGRRFDGN